MQIFSGSIVTIVVLISVGVYGTPPGHEERAEAQEQEERRIKRDDQDSSGINIQFQIPDLVTPYITGNDEVQLEAYKVRSKEEWVSIGQPYFIKQADGSMYEYSPEAIKVYIRLLSDEQKNALKDEAKRRNASSDPTINLIPLQSFTCDVHFVLGKREYNLQGMAQDLTRLNALFTLPYSENNEKRDALVARLKQNDTSPEWTCKFEAAGKQLQTNSIKISAQQIQDVALEGQLFGKGSETYVSRSQMNILTQKIRQRLAIDEEYEIEGEEFDQKLFSKLLDLASQPFQQMKIDDALSMLSKYGAIGDERDLSPSEIKKQMSNILEVKKEGSKQFILAKNDTKREGTSEDEHEVGTEVSAKVGVPAIVDVESKVAVKVANKHRDTWNNTDATLDKQLQELNSESQNQAQWEIEGNRIVPKSLNVAKLSKAKLETEINIAYKKSYVKDAAYKKTVVLETSSIIPAPIESETQHLKLTIRKLDDNILAISTKFDSLTEKWNRFVQDTSTTINELKTKVSGLSG